MFALEKPVLAFESSLGGCTGAVIGADGRVLSAFSFETDRDQAAKLMPCVQDCMAEAKTDFNALGLIATTVGPGSFTGLRIGLSAARAMGLALNIPVVGLRTLAIMARSCFGQGAHKSLVVLESKRADFYVQAFDEDFKPESEAACLSAAQTHDLVQGRILCGDAVERLQTENGTVYAGAVHRRLLDPPALAQSGLSFYESNAGRISKPEPLYLRGADVSVSNKVSRKINDCR